MTIYLHLIYHKREEGQRQREKTWRKDEWRTRNKCPKDSKRLEAPRLERERGVSAALCTAAFWLCSMWARGGRGNAMKRNECHRMNIWMNEPRNECITNSERRKTSVDKGNACFTSHMTLDSTLRLLRTQRQPASHTHYTPLYPLPLLSCPPPATLQLLVALHTALSEWSVWQHFNLIKNVIASRVNISAATLYSYPIYHILSTFVATPPLHPLHPAHNFIAGATFLCLPTCLFNCATCHNICLLLPPPPNHAPFQVCVCAYVCVANECISLIYHYKLPATFRSQAKLSFMENNMKIFSYKSQSAVTVVTRYGEYYRVLYLSVVLNNES